MRLIDIIIIVLIVGFCFWICYSAHRRKKMGGGCHCQGCSGCSARSQCSYGKNGSLSDKDISDKCCAGDEDNCSKKPQK